MKCTPKLAGSRRAVTDIRELVHPIAGPVTLDSIGPAHIFQYTESDGGAVRRLGGLHNFNQRLFYPGFVYPTFKPDPKSNNGAPAGPVGGKMLGIRVDNNISHYLQGHTRYENMCHPAQRVISAITNHLKWTPAGAQITIASLAYRTATQADLICRTQSGDLALVEVKTGYEGYFDTYQTGMMHGCLSDVPNTCYNQWQLQMLWMKTVLRDEYDLDIPYANVRLVHSTSTHITLYKLGYKAKWIKERENSILEAWRTNGHDAGM